MGSPQGETQTCLLSCIPHTMTDMLVRNGQVKLGRVPHMNAPCWSETTSADLHGLCLKTSPVMVMLVEHAINGMSSWHPLQLVLQLHEENSRFFHRHRALRNCPCQTQDPLACHSKATRSVTFMKRNSAGWFQLKQQALDKWPGRCVRALEFACNRKPRKRTLD